MRVKIVSDGDHPHYRYALFYDGDPRNGGELIASKVVRSMIEGDNYIWTEWKSEGTGIHELWVVVLEHSDGPTPGNNSDMLRVNVSDGDGNSGCFIATACHGTPVADFIKKHPVLKKIVRTALRPVVWVSRKMTE